jgi:ADP-ribose pyrophosphatase YjhB (NUDIX family)
MSLERTMITFNRGDQCFNFRVAGIAIDNDHVLLHRAAGDAFWTFPGGRAEIGETTSQTLVREIKEELNEDVEVVRLLWVVENFFEYAQRNYHEIAFYFLMKLSERSPYLAKEKSFSSVEENTALEFKWFPIDADILTGLPLLPAFLQQSLNNLPNSVEQVVERS